MTNDFLCKNCKCVDFKIEYNTFPDNMIPENHIVISCKNCERCFVIKFGKEILLDDMYLGILDILKDWEKNK